MDFVVTAVKTTEGGHQGISFVVIEKGMDGFSVAGKPEKLGWHASDTGELSFEDVPVPEENLLGDENRGFYLIMANFQWSGRAGARCGGPRWSRWNGWLRRPGDTPSSVAQLAVKLEARARSPSARALPLRRRARRDPRG